MSEAKEFRSGFIPIVGKPNVGKSSIMNAMIGEKIAIVSNRPQTTRNRIMGVITTEKSQFVFLDTPGIHDPRTRLGEYMMHSVRDAMEGMDCVLMVVDVTYIREKDLEIARSLAERKVPKILCINKIDLVKPEEILRVTSEFAGLGFDEIIPVSALTGSGLEDLSRCLTQRLPAGPKYFPEDMMTDQPERLLCAEIIREKALRHLRDEIPHGIGVEMMQIESISPELTEMHATLYCERDSHKRIIIGKQGSMLKVIGSEAREDIEKLMGVRVNLQLWVKVRPDWRNNLSDLKTLGYESK
jgi:GTP-binding protein Era